MTATDIRPEDVFEGLDAHGARLDRPWRPQVRSPDAPPDLTVRSQSRGASPTEFSNLQQAVDRAVLLGAKTLGPRIIDIGPGVFDGPVIVPRTAPPLVLRGAGAEATVIAAPIDAQMTGSDYAVRFKARIAQAGPQSRPAFVQIAACGLIGTRNTAVLRLMSDDVALSGLTIRNDYACDRASAAPADDIPDAEGRFARGQHQAVALMLDQADRVLVTDCVMSSYQDTLYLRGAANRLSRALFETCRIEGDVDFIFGGATAFFQRCEVKSRGRRGAQSWALAPSTSLHQAHGLVFRACAFTHDGAEAGQDGRCFLGRQWFEGVRATPYGTPTLAGYSCELGQENRFDPPLGTISSGTLEAVGKALLIGCGLGPHLRSAQLWDDWASGRWSPRFRPVQTGGADFVRFLKDWLPEEGAAAYERIIGDHVWLHHA